MDRVVFIRRNIESPSFQHRAEVILSGRHTFAVERYFVFAPPMDDL